MQQTVSKMKRRLLIVTFATVFSVGYYMLVEGEVTIKPPITDFKQLQVSGNGNVIEHVGVGINADTKGSEVHQVNQNISVNISSTITTSPSTTTTTTTTKAPPYTVPNDGYPYGYVINNHRSCHTDEELRLVMVVVSAPMNFATRLAIRRTWGVAAARKDVSMVFILGGINDTDVQKKLLDEDKLYGDMVQEDFVDTYRNLTLKSIALLRWVNLFCVNAQFVLKVDDDNFVNVPNLLGFLTKNKDKKKVIYGKIWRKVKPIRDKKSKWSVSEVEYEGDSYPDYTGGPAYVISIDSVQGLLDAARKLKSFPLEDVFITGVCAEHAKVARVDETHFQVTTDVVEPCTFRKLISAHGVSSSSLYVAWWYTNDPLFDTCEVAKDKQTCAQQSRHVLVDFASLVTNKMVKLP